MSTVAETLRKLLPRLRAVAPAGAPVDEIIENVIYAVSTDPDLEKCSTQSIVDAVFEAVSLGLDPSGLGRDGVLIPRQTKHGVFRAVFVPDYRALLRLMTQNGRVSHVETRIVRKHDKFSLNFGDPTGRIITHSPVISGEDGDPIGAYAIAWFHDSERPLVEWMTKEEIDANAGRGGSYRAQNSPWDTDWAAMARKTVLKRLAKYLVPQLTAAVGSANCETRLAWEASHEETRDDKPSAAARNSHPQSLAAEYRWSIETAAPDGLDAVIQAIREDDRLDHMEKTELFNFACKRKKELSRKA